MSENREKKKCVLSTYDSYISKREFWMKKKRLLWRRY